MAVHSSITTNDSLPSSVININSFDDCLKSTVGAFILTAFAIASILLLVPLCVFVLYLGHQRSRRHGFCSKKTHSDFFTHHMVVIELLCVFGSILICCGIHANLRDMTMFGTYLFSLNITGQVFFHMLTCLERYLAVVYPMIYLSLRKAKGIRIRNIIVCCVWLLSLLRSGFIWMTDQTVISIFSFSVAIFFIIIVTFCSLSVLCVLLRPGPGEGGGDRQRVDQSKRRAFYTIIAILGVLLFRFGGIMLSTTLYASSKLREREMCDVFLSGVWFSLPSSLVLPLLFVKRAGKLLCCKNGTESGQASG